MASLRHENSGGRNCWVVRAYINKKRVSISLGAMVEHRAKDALDFIEHLIERKEAGKLPDRKAYKWLDEIDTDLHDRLSKNELITARRLVDRPTTILAFFRDYIKERTDWKKPQNYSQAVDHLEKFMGRDVALSAFTKGDGERWHRWMIEHGLSPNTAGQNVKRCRQMLWSAVSDELLAKNPLEGIRVSSDSDKSKDFYVERSAYELILEHCPNTQWRVMVALSRIGGLRCPSEVMALRWNDINWERSRFKVTSPKTARSGKASRVIPLFPELRAELEKLYNEVGPGINVPIDSPVITIRKSSACNLRTQLNRIVELASLKPWAKPFMAMRTSRRTELERSGKHPNHVLNTWLGHTRNIAEKHYLKVLEADFEAATDSPLSHSLSHQVGSNSPTEAITEPQEPNKKRALMARDGSRGEREYTQLDSKQIQNDPVKSLVELVSGVDCERPVVPLVVPSAGTATPSVLQSVDPCILPSGQQAIRLIAIAPELSPDSVELLKTMATGLLSVSESDLHYLKTYFQSLPKMTEAEKSLCHSMARQALGMPLFATDGEVKQ